MFASERDNGCNTSGSGRQKEGLLKYEGEREGERLDRVGERCLMDGDILSNKMPVCLESDKKRGRMWWKGGITGGSGRRV